ncbi:PspC domain-containing protein [Myceligenerans pegani]|uniref:PspC domain-containing protein n=1 Tax=Myceligenerans pegani TaxID=2776917 RepID=A0ABR9MSL3_9MICO|nr:PspC domain-containing protein [Myceligenerans sp. TRM 65318]MBE1874362.1 PspC domain-containing protein [Myceligenerans sp. TRM 65318]MBE3016633.1 PspC domain-containing protein [Myceligenerans sp. TRM 65318]
MTTDPTAGEGPTPSGEPEPSAQQTSFEEQPPPQPQQPPAAQPRPAGSGFFDSIRRTGLYRADRRWVGGVAGGVAARLGWDPLLVRGLFVITFFLGGIGLIAYGVGWALLPEQSDGRIHLEQAIRGNFDVALLGAAVLFLFGFAWGGPWDWGFYGDSEWIAALFWLAVIGGIVYLLIQAVRRRPSTEGQPHAQPYPQQYAAQPYAGTTAAAARSGPGTTTATAPAGPATAPGSGPTSPTTNGTVGIDDRPAGNAPPAAAPYGGAPIPPYAASPTPSAGAPYAQPLPPRPPRRKGGGAGIVVGLILLTGALLLLNELVLGSRIPYVPTGEAGVWAAWLGTSLVIVGIAIVVAGLRGRSSGGLGALGIIGLVLAVPTLGTLQTDVSERIDEGRAIVGDVFEFDGRVDGFEPGAPISEGTFSPNRIEEAERGYSVSWGDPTIDLTDLDLSGVDPAEPVQVPIAVGAGTATVVVPEDAAVELEGQIAAGALEWLVDGDERTYGGGTQQRVEIASDEVDDDGAQLRLFVEVAAGELIIEEEQ